MGIEQYITRELKSDIKRLIRKVTELDTKIEELKASQKVYTLSHNASGDVYTESKKMQDELEPIKE
jgi:phage shock protein A